MENATRFSGQINTLRLSVDRRLDELLPAAESGPGRLAEAARYAVLAPGKRFRPMLTLLTSSALGADGDAGLDVACAMEMIHAASLILDDLPCMDDALLRRGRPTAHRAFGESTAILAAIALLARAFGVIAAAEALSPEHRARLAAALSDAVGFKGLAAGQVRDLGRREAQPGPGEIDLLNHEKTGVLIMVSAQAGAWIARAPEATAVAMATFARELGLAFQIRDDLIDGSASSDAVGKDVGKDAGLATLVSTLGPAGAEDAMRARLDAAQVALSKAGVADTPLAWYARDLFQNAQAAA